MFIIGFGISTRANAADMSALDFNGELLGKVIPDGSVINFDNELIGHITADGYVLNNNDDLIGAIVPQGIVISTKNEILGKVNNDGSVTSSNDSLLGKVLPSGLVVDNNYDVIGAVISPGLVYNDQGNIVGRVSGDGRFYDLSGNNGGFVSATGYVYNRVSGDKNVELVGKLISSKMVISSTGKFMGSIAPDGKVLDQKRNIIGNIHANGFAYNSEGMAIGHIVESGYAFAENGDYLGIVSYNGEITDKGQVIARASFNNRVINNEGDVIGFTIGTAATANTLDGKYLGRVIAGGAVVKARNVIGKIGATGNVVDDNGNVIGFINQTGPIFDYLGQLKADASVNGSVASLEGIEQGYMQKTRAFDRKNKEVGRTLNNHICLDNANNFIGMSGISSELAYDGKIYTISPYGYVFDEEGDISGRNYKFSSIYSLEGTNITNLLSNGRAENSVLNDKGKLTVSGFFLDKNNQILGKVISENYVTDFLGKNLGYINQTNLVADDKNNFYAKILPNRNVVTLNDKSNKVYGQAGDAPLSISINGDYLGANMEDGSINKAGEVIGRITSNQYVVDNQGALYGKAISFGVVVAPNCKFLGVVSENGDARTSKGAYLGTILANNQVVNDTEEVIGYVVHPQNVNGKNGDILGVENTLGAVLNYKNQNLGCRDIYGKIRNSQKEIIGQSISYAPVINFDNKIIGYTNLEGKVTDYSGNILGFVDVNGGVRTDTEEDLGVLFKYTVAFDDDNIYLGRVSADGKIIADNGESIGDVRYNGSVTTNSGKSGFALYDLYVYDNDGKTVGYIAKNGKVYSIMGEMKGAIYHGFVLDKKQNLIARGLRDYDIRDENHKIIGYLNLDGTVVNTQNIKIGDLSDNGEIINAEGQVIAKAEDLQYYHKPVTTEKEKESREKQSAEQELTAQQTEQQVSTESVVSEEPSEEDSARKEEVSKPDVITENIQETTKPHGKIVSIAISPNGQYIGKITDTQDVLDDNGNKIGTVNEKGEIFGLDGKRLGSFEEQSAQQPQKMNSKWWQSVAKNVTVSPWDDTTEPVNLGPDGGIGPGGRYNPRRAAILNQLYSNRRQTISGKVISNGKDVSLYTGWQDDWGTIGTPKEAGLSTLRVDMSNVITADKPIPAVLARSVISLGEAPVTAIVERNIYADAGRNVIIPAGSRVIGGLEGGDMGGRFDSESGGMKMDITWNRIIRPDGIAFDISTAKTGDAEGRGGGALGYVDEQILKKYTVPLLGTLASSAMAYLMAANEDATGEVETSKQQAASDARENFLNKMDSILNKIIENKEKIQAVTYIPAGTRIIIYPMRDLWLRTNKDISDNLTINNTGAKDVLIDDNNASGGGNDQNSQNNNNNNNNNNNPSSLIDEGNSNKQNNSGNTNVGALPPPAADGSGMNIPDVDEEDSGEIDLDF